MESFRIKWKGQESGPYTEPELRKMLANREIRSMHEIEVAGEWKTIRSFFKEQDQSAAPPPAKQEAPPEPPTSSTSSISAHAASAHAASVHAASAHAASAEPVPPAAPQSTPPPVPPEPAPSPVPPEQKSKTEGRSDSVSELVSREAEDALRANEDSKEENNAPFSLRKSLLPKPDISDNVMKQTRAGEFLVHGGFWYRVLALLADLVIVYALPLLILGWLFQTDLPPQDPITVLREIFALGPLGVALLALTAVLIWIYFASMESSRMRGTLGKKIFGLVVTDELGNRVSFQRASLRFFSKLLSALIVFAGFFLAAFTRRKQGLHDLISRCTVNHALPPTRLLRRTPHRTQS